MSEMTTPLPPADTHGVADYVVKGGWYTLWVMVVLVLVSAVDRQVLVLLGAPVATSLNLTDGKLGVILGLAPAIFAIIAVYPIAWAADRFDRRLVFALCVLVWSLGTAACGLAQNYEQLFVAAVAIAAGEAALNPIGIAFVPDLFKGRKRLLANSLFYVFASMGSALGLMVSGGAIALVDHLHGDLPESLRIFEAWRLAFFLVALPTPVFLILIAFTRLGQKSARPKAVRYDAPPQNFWPFVRQHGRAVLWLFGGIGCYGMGTVGYALWLPTAATRMFGTTPAQNGTVMGIAQVIGLMIGVSIGTFVVRRLVVKLGPMASIRFYWITLLAATPIFIVFPFVSSSWQLFTLFGVLMIANTAAGCAIPTIMQDMAPAELRGRMAAMWTIIAALLGGLSPTLIGWLSAGLGPDPRMLIVAISLVAVPAWIMAALCFRMAERPFAALVRHVADGDASSNNQ